MALRIEEDLLYADFGVKTQAQAREVKTGQQAADKIVAGRSKAQAQAAHRFNTPGVIAGIKKGEPLLEPGQEVPLEHAGKIFFKRGVKNKSEAQGGSLAGQDLRQRGGVSLHGRGIGVQQRHARGIKRRRLLAQAVFIDVEIEPGGAQALRPRWQLFQNQVERPGPGAGGYKGHDNFSLSEVQRVRERRVQAVIALGYAVSVRY